MIPLLAYMLARVSKIRLRIEGLIMIYGVIVGIILYFIIKFYWTKYKNKNQ